MIEAPFMGYRAKDKVTNITGVIDQYSWSIEGITRYSLQQEIKGDEAVKEYPSGFIFDSPQVEILDKKFSFDLNSVEDFKFNFGDKVLFKNAGLSGIIERKILYLNGCKGYGFRLNVADLQLKGEKLIIDKVKELVWTMEANIELVSPVEQSKLNNKPSGGPVEKSHRIN